MTILYQHISNSTNLQVRTKFDVNAALEGHGWFPELTIQKCEIALANEPTYTYAIYPSRSEREFTISFKNKHGYIEHHPLTLLSPSHGIWRNSGPDHIGKLEKVISDVLDNHEGRPLKAIR